MIFIARCNALVVFIAFALIQQTALGDHVLDTGLRKMAKKIYEFMDSEGYSKEMIVGDFSAPPRLKASGGVELSRAITEALRAEGIRIHDDARYQIYGKFRIDISREWAEDSYESLGLEIKTTILDDQDEELAILPIKVYGSAALQIAGIDVDVPASYTEEKRQKSYVKQYRKPETYIPAPKEYPHDETDLYERQDYPHHEKTADINKPDSYSPVGYQVRPSRDSQYGMEILVSKGAYSKEASIRPLSKDSKGRAYVQLHKGEEYLVRLRNDSNHEVAVELTVDGVNVFELSHDVGLRKSNVLLAPHGSYLLPGWFRSLQKSNAFEIGGFAQSVAKKTGASSASVGVITAKFRASWDPMGPPPADEPSWHSKSAVPPSKATILGREILQSYERAHRKFGVVRAVVSIRYDKREAY